MSASTKRQRGPVDVRIEHHGSLYLLRPQTTAAWTWVSAHTPADSQYFDGALVVEPRYVGDVLVGMRNEGLVVQ